MYRLGTRCAFIRLNSVVFQKITTNGKTDRNVLFFTDKYYKETIRSSCAAFSSTVLKTSNRTDDVTKLRPVFEDVTPNANQVYPVLFPKFSNYDMKSTKFLGRETVKAQVQTARLAREYSTCKLLPVKNIYRSASAGFSSEVPRVLISSEEFTDFMSIFPEIVQDVIQDANVAGHPEVPKRISKLLDYNATGGKKNSPMILLAAYKAFANPEQLTSENLRKAQILAWCCQLEFTAVLMFDDMMDGTEMRRGKPCWYRQKEVGMIGINDAMMVDCAGLLLLRRHFRQHPRYVSLVEEYQNSLLITTIGQSLDLQCTRDGKPQLDLFTMARYDAIVQLKTTFALYSPVAFATVLAGVDVEMKTKTKNLMVAIGQWYQEQDDILDYTGTTDVTGKDVGNDIKDGKCTWLAVTALERASPQQRVIMERCYGSANPEHIQAIRDLYDQLDIAHLYAVREEEVLVRLHSQIDRDFSGKPQEIFHRILDTMYNRKC